MNNFSTLKKDSEYISKINIVNHNKIDKIYSKISATKLIDILIIQMYGKSLFYDDEYASILDTENLYLAFQIEEMAIATLFNIIINNNYEIMESIKKLPQFQNQNVCFNPDLRKLEETNDNRVKSLFDFDGDDL